MFLTLLFPHCHHELWVFTLWCWCPVTLLRISDGQHEPFMTHVLFTILFALQVDSIWEHKVLPITANTYYLVFMFLFLFMFRTPSWAGKQVGFLKSTMCPLHHAWSDNGRPVIFDVMHYRRIAAMNLAYCPLCSSHLWGWTLTPQSNTAARTLTSMSSGNRSFTSLEAILIPGRVCQSSPISRPWHFSGSSLSPFIKCPMPSPPPPSVPLKCHSSDSTHRFDMCVNKTQACKCPIGPGLDISE